MPWMEVALNKISIKYKINKSRRVNNVVWLKLRTKKATTAAFTVQNDLIHCLHWDKLTVYTLICWQNRHFDQEVHISVKFSPSALVQKCYWSLICWQCCPFMCFQLKPQRVWRSSLIFLVPWVSMMRREAKRRRRWICQRKTTKTTDSSRSDTSSFRTSTVWLYVKLHS